MGNYFHKFSAVEEKINCFGAIWDKFVENVYLVQI